MLGLDGDAVSAGSMAERLDRVYRAFLDHTPYETLSNARACGEAPQDPECWPRTTDRFLRENRAHGFGGTSFTLAYALRDLFRGVGANAHCTLGRNLVTEEAHAAVLVYDEAGPLLFDPTLLLSGAVPVRPGGVLEDPLGLVRLEPRSGPTLTLMLRMHCEDRDRRVYTLIPVPAAPQAYRQAWIASFWRGRVRPLWMARRVGDEIRRYGERPGHLEVLRRTCRSQIRLGPAPVRTLHDAFGVDERCLSDWFTARDGRTP
jgi:hypothetical protein